MDVDVVAEMNDEAVAPFLRQLGSDYYASEPTIRDAIRRKTCFNLVHYPTSFKVDVFISRDRSFDRDCMARAIVGEIGSTAKLQIPVASPEDTIISKLEWYKIGDETSDQQWRDVATVLKLLGDQADLDYLRRAAESVGVDELLARLRAMNQ